MRAEADGRAATSVARDLSSTGLRLVTRKGARWKRARREMTSGLTGWRGRTGRGWPGKLPWRRRSATGRVARWRCWPWSPGVPAGSCWSASAPARNRSILAVARSATSTSPASSRMATMYRKVTSGAASCPRWSWPWSTSTNIRRYSGTIGCTCGGTTRRWVLWRIDNTGGCLESSVNWCGEQFFSPKRKFPLFLERCNCFWDRHGWRNDAGIQSFL